MTQDRDIKYTNRDFTDYRNQLVEFAKNYFPDTYNDFSEASPGMMFIEMASYVGAVLGFYQDIQLQETFLQYAKNQANLYDLAYTMGYRPRATSVSEVEVTISQIVDAVQSGSTYVPDYNQAAVIAENMQLLANSNGLVNFLTSRRVDFSVSSSYDPTEVLINEIDVNGIPVTFQLTKKVKAYSGTIQTATFNIGALEKFKTITITSPNIVKILDVIDSDTNQWTEVPYLGQDTVFVPQTNTAQDQPNVPYSLAVQSVPRRFVTRFKNENILNIQFGPGMLGTNDSTYLPDPTNVGLGVASPVNRLDYAYDPSNFLHNQSYGLAPSNTTLTVRYVTGGGVLSNVPANTITSIIAATVTSAGTDNSRLGTSSITVNNPKPAQGGKDGDTVEELRQNSLKSFNEQLRTVTLQDYTVRALSLPSEYGAIAKVYAGQYQERASSNPLAINLHVLAYDSNRNLINATDTLKQNLKTYLAQYIPVTDALNILDAVVVNIGVNYDITVRPNFSSRDVLQRCTAALIDYFDIRKWSINQPINLSEIYTLLDKIKGVQTVQNIQIRNILGNGYSEYEYSIVGATRNGLIFPSYDPMIFEVKVPAADIKGRVVTL
jgi:hypothetical protein